MSAVSLQATNEVVYRVPKATQEEMTAAVDSCSRAFRTWSETSILARQQIFLRYQQMIKDNIVSQGASGGHIFIEKRAPTKIDPGDLSCYRKNLPSPLHWSRGRLLLMQRAMCSEDCVSSVALCPRTCMSLKGQHTGKCLRVI